MLGTKPFHVDRLQSELDDKQRINPAFSIRAYARYLGIQAPTLAAVLKNKRNLPRRSAKSIASKLSLSPVETKHFFESIERNKKWARQPLAETTPGTLLEEEARFRIIAEWEHYAILSLLDTRGFKSDPAWIADRLGISRSRAERCLENLTQAKLVRREEAGTLRKCEAAVRTTEDIASRALRQAHRENMDLAKEKLETVPVMLRDFSGVTLTVRPEDLPELKHRIRRFRSEFARAAESGETSEVYQLTIHFFPLTRAQSSEQFNERGKT